MCGGASTANRSQRSRDVARWRPSHRDARVVRRAPAGTYDLSSLSLGSHALGDSASRRAAIDALIGRLKYRPLRERAALVAELVASAGRLSRRPIKGELGQVWRTIRVTEDRDGHEHEVARRGDGDVVGEMSLITREPRVASLIADGPIRTLRLGNRDFESMLRERPGIAMAQLLGPRMLLQRALRSFLLYHNA